jgi:hypothetical protein
LAPNYFDILHPQFAASFCGEGAPDGNLSSMFRDYAKQVNCFWRNREFGRTAQTGL